MSFSYTGSIEIPMTMDGYHWDTYTSIWTWYRGINKQLLNSSYSSTGTLAFALILRVLLKVRTRVHV